MSRQRNIYLSPDDLYDAIREAQELGEPTVRLCDMIRLIAQHMLRSARFGGYSRELKEDLQSAALEKCLKSYKNVTPEKKSGCFSYLTLACQCAFYGVLRKHYNQVNLVRELTLENIARLERLDPIGAQRMRDYMDEE